ncbi:MAG: hypothetical protein ACYSU8_02590 [Planctomycetota bacterium]
MYRDGFSEKKINHGIDAPGDVVLDDDLLALNISNIFTSGGIGRIGKDLAGDADGQADLLCLDVAATAVGNTVGGGQQGFGRRVGVVIPQTVKMSARVGPLLFDEPLNKSRVQQCVLENA